MRLSWLGPIALAAVIANAQELDLPRELTKRLASPDGSKILYGEPYEKGKRGGPQLWIEDARTHRRTKLFNVRGTLSAAWSLDGTAFYVNDHWASDRERAYLYDAATLQRLDIAALIQAQDPESRQFANGHAYYAVDGWEGTEDITVRFTGHTDRPPIMNFDFRYRVSRAGVVKQLSQHTAPLKN